jgi:MFS family permease
MDRHTSRVADNAKWLLCLAPFRALSISAAYLTPFFLEKGMTLSEIFLLQSAFSLAYLLLEVPSGWFADRYGRAFSIRLSAPIAAVSMIAYGFSDHFWQFIVWEIALAVANSLLSGVDTALLTDSLKATGKERQYVRVAQRIDALNYAATAVGVPIAFVLVHFYSISWTLVADGLLMFVGVFFSWKLVEAPRFNGGQEAERLSAWQSARQLARNAEARWLIVLGSVLSLATYLGFWLSAPYYTDLGIPVALFGALLAIRSLWKAWLSHRFHAERQLERSMATYAALAGLVYLAMASGQLWLAWAVLGHDMVQALHKQPVIKRLNGFFHDDHRATLNSVVNLWQRLLYTLAGPLVGLLVDRAGLRAGFIAVGLICSGAAFLALAKLRALQTFRQRR